MHERKHFLDWLRVIAFGLLILFHVGLLYSSWPYNLKSPRLYPAIEFALNALNPWRLALLFFISGVACRFLLEKLRPRAFARDRVRRLLPVIAFGMLVVVPPQTYVELVDRGLVTTGYLEFWLGSYLVGAPFPGKILPTWDHLWFLVYLLPYSLALAALFFWRSDRIAEACRRAPLPCLVAFPGVGLCIANLLVVEFQPVTHAFVDDWAAHLRWLGMFGAGVACAQRADFWETTRAQRATLAALACAFLLGQWGCIAAWNAGRLDPLWDGILYSVLRGLYGWTAILALSGFAMQHLARSAPTLEYLNVAVLPVYVLHQPILLIAAFWLFPLELPIVVEASLLVAITGAAALAIHEVVIRRSGLGRFLFGLKSRSKRFRWTPSGGLRGVDPRV